MMPVHQRCPICHEWFWGSDAIGSPCDSCASIKPPINDMVESLRKFVECEHKHWECTQCHCRTDAGTIAAPWRGKVNKLEKQLTAARELLNLARDAYRGCYDLNDEWAKKAAEVSDGK